eukprot:6181120-Pleurochrysis_carterae.AAC.3
MQFLTNPVDRSEMVALDGAGGADSDGSVQRGQTRSVQPRGEARHEESSVSRWEHGCTRLSEMYGESHWHHQLMDMSTCYIPCSCCLYMAEPRCALLRRPRNFSCSSASLPLLYLMLLLQQVTGAGTEAVSIKDTQFPVADDEVLSMVSKLSLEEKVRKQTQSEAVEDDI